MSTTLSSPSATTFSVTVERLEGRLILRLPNEASAELPSRGQVAVSGRIDDQRFTTVVEPDGRRGHWIAVGHPAGPELTEGETVTIELIPSKQWPEPDVPADLTAALAEADDIDQTWTDITVMARWEWVRWISATKNPDTRQRRVEATMSKLQSGKRRPCCFDLASCTDPELSRSGKLLEPQ